MKRRDALKTIGGLAGAAGMARFLPGCGGNGDDGPVGITTYVYLMMENRSYDHWFGARKLLEGLGGDGLAAGMANPDLDGKLVEPWRPTADQLCDLDPPHGRTASFAQLNGGLNDGFLTQHQLDHDGSRLAIDPMQYLTRAEIPVSWTLADSYTTCDRWFCSVLGPTFPNRFYWHTGESGGLTSNVIPDGGITWGSIYHRLDARGVDWAYYFGSLPVVGLIQGLPGIDGKLRRFQQFLEEAAAGTLPPVVYIDPAFNVNDDHPPAHPIFGQELIAAVYNALARSPQWKNIMLVVTYDENGGFFDHVAPPKVFDKRAADGFDQLGFRVPALVAGPYAKQNHVSSVQYDHCSALRHLEVAFDLEPVNERTAGSADLADCIDLDRLARGEPAEPIELPVIDILNFPLGTSCASARKPDGGLVEWYERHPDRMAAYDRRSELPEYTRSIRNFLARRTGVTVR